MRDALQNSSPQLDRKVTTDNTVMGAKVLTLRGHHTQTHAHRCTHRDTHAHMDTRTHRDTLTNTHACTDTCVHMDTHAHMCTQTHAHRHTCSHRHMHTYHKTTVTGGGRQEFPSPGKRGREARGMLRAPPALILGSARPLSAG